MNFVEQLSAVVLLVDFLLGMACGVVGCVSHGSRREDRDKTLLGTAPDAASDGARLVHGLYTRDDGGYMRSLLARGGEAAGGTSGGDGTQGQGRATDQRLRAGYRRHSRVFRHRDRSRCAPRHRTTRVAPASRHF